MSWQLAFFNRLHECFIYCVFFFGINFIFGGSSTMSDFNWCHGPNCHEKHTVDRVRGVKGSKVLRTRKIKIKQLEQ